MLGPRPEASQAQGLAGALGLCHRPALSINREAFIDVRIKVRRMNGVLRVLIYSFNGISSQDKTIIPQSFVQ